MNVLKQDLPAEVLFHDDFVRNPTSLYQLLRDCVVLKVLQTQMSRSKNRLPKGTV